MRTILFWHSCGIIIHMNYIEIIIRLLAATLVGILIGYERTLAHKNAGIRTHALLCISTCSLTIVVSYLQPDEMTRLIAGLVQGVGFIGAGVIFMNKENTLQGLTSSVIIWFTAAMGIVIATNYWPIAAIGVGIYFFVENVVYRWEVKIKADQNKNHPSR